MEIRKINTEINGISINKMANISWGPKRRKYIKKQAKTVYVKYIVLACFCFKLQKGRKDNEKTK